MFSYPNIMEMFSLLLNRYHRVEEGMNLLAYHFSLCQENKKKKKYICLLIIVFNQPKQRKKNELICIISITDLFE